METLIPVVELKYSRQESDAQAVRNLNAVNLDHRDDDPRYDFMVALEQDIPARAKLNRLKKGADALGKVVKPYSACKSGCSYCCHISALICETEARVLAKASGRKMKAVTGVPGPEIVQKWVKVPCPFLVKGRCSVYEDRPITCRLLYNMADSPEQCDTRIPSEDSYVPLLNLQQLQEGFYFAFANENWGDIRDFFPPA